MSMRSGPRSPSAAPLLKAPDGPELRWTKTHRTYRVELDLETLDVLIAHRVRAETRAHDAGVEITGSAFVFSDRLDGAQPWLPNWLTSSSSRHDVPRASRISGYTTCAISWPPRC